MEIDTIRTQPLGGPLEPSALKDLVVSSLDSDKALDIEAINLMDQDSALADYMVIASGTSSRQVLALADKLKHRLESIGCKGISIEGMNDGNWVILDAGDIIVHLFRPEVRDFYQIEKMWAMPLSAADSAGSTLRA